MTDSDRAASHSDWDIQVLDDDTEPEDDHEVISSSFE